MVARWLQRKKTGRRWMILSIFDRGQRAVVARRALPTDWHRRPVNQEPGPCAICGYPLKSGKHRAVAPQEQMLAKWLRQRKTKDGPRTSPPDLFTSRLTL